jgi:hypothetical protein
MDNAVPQRVDINLQHPLDDNSLPFMQQNERRNQMWQETQLPKAKKARSQTERVEGVALTEFYNPGETVIPSDGKWKVMGPEWLEKLEKAKHQDDLFSGIQTSGHTLKYQMHLSPTEGQTMWVLRHHIRCFDVLMRKRKS